MSDVLTVHIIWAVVLLRCWSQLMAVVRSKQVDVEKGSVSVKVK